MRPVVLLLIGLFFLGIATTVRAAEKPDPVEEYASRLQRIRNLLDQACREAGTSLDRLGYAPADLTLCRDEFRLARFDAWFGDPLRFKVACDTFSAGLRDSANRPETAHDLLARLLDVPFWRHTPGKPEIGKDPTGQAVNGLQQVFRLDGRDLAEGERASAKTAFDGLPPEIRAALADFLSRVASGMTNLKVAFDGAGLGQAGVFLKQGEMGWLDDAGRFRQPLFEFCRDLDMRTVLHGTKMITRATVDFYSTLKRVFCEDDNPPPIRPFRIDTPFGAIAVASRGQDSHPAGRYLLLVDLGGDDTYGAGAGGADFGQLASVCIDLAGDDRYVAGEKDAPSFGAALLGAGILIDREGKDVYESHSRAQGYAEFGAAILVDENGDDRYTVHTGGQGYGHFGLGALLDAGGADRYTCFHLAQGVGRTRGAGALVDRDGDDVYTARDDEIVHPSPQSGKHNSSLSQGCGFGRRADMSDGHSVAGGVGLLVDGGGDDAYSGGVMAQSHGYWYGAGVLVDYGGDDAYKAAWYGQSSSAHFGLSYFRDGAGNDVYHTTMSQTLGNGRDFSLSWFEDDGGDDRYTVVDRGAGCGDINGVGVFLDLSGSDVYDVRSPVSMGIGTLGAKTSMMRRQIHTTGLFIDAGGKDTYQRKSTKKRWPACANNTTWKRDGLRLEFSLGMDRGE